MREPMRPRVRVATRQATPPADSPGDSATPTPTGPPGADASAAATDPVAVHGDLAAGTAPARGLTRAELAWAARTAVPAWVAARLVVAGALAFVHELASPAHLSSPQAARVHEGLLGWDAGWYEAIARHGYGGAGHLSLRFFPLVPVLTRAIASVPGIGAGAALLVLGNVSSLVAVVLIAVLARRESHDAGLSRRAAWLLCLAPAAFTQVMGYAEGTLLALAIGTFLALRARAWWWAGVLGLAAAATRPVGVLLVVPAAVEGLRSWRRAPWREKAARGAAVVAPGVGFGAFLGFVAWRYGDGLAPLRVQQGSTLRGGLSDPLRTLAHDCSLLVHGHHLGTALHLPWALLAVALTVVAFVRWPASYGAFAAAVLAVALTAANLDGFERYALSAFPLVLAGAAVSADERVERAVIAIAAAGLALYAALAFTNLYVP